MLDRISTNTITSSTLMVSPSDTNPSDRLRVTMNYKIHTFSYRISHCQLAAQFLSGSNAHHQYLGHCSGQQLPAHGHGEFMFIIWWNYCWLSDRWYTDRNLRPGIEFFFLYLICIKPIVPFIGLTLHSLLFTSSQLPELCNVGQML